MKIMKRCPFIKRYYLCLIPIVLILMIKPKNNSFSLSVDNLSNLSFRNQLINQRLKSYSLIYENLLRECDTSSSLTSKQNESFLSISKALNLLRQEIVPYPNEYFHDRGIVLTVAVNDLRLARANLRMLQVSNTRLPVQIWYSSTQIPHGIMFGLLNEAPKLKSSACCFDTNQCRTLTGIWQLNAIHVYKPSHTTNLSKQFPYKPAAILSATFAEVLFLDCDAYVTRDPDDLFLSDPMYLKFGALFYPDAFQSRQHPLIWKILNTSCTPEEYELDSATILVDKKRVWNGLYLTKLMNDNHQLFYGHITDGDKDTFRFAFRYMNVKYYLVMIPCATGSLNGSHFCGKTICKTDSLGQHIYFNHIHLLKREGMRYRLGNLDYTRIGLGDPNNNSLSFAFCRIPETPIRCFYIMKHSNLPIVRDRCSVDEISSEEIEDYQYTLNQPLLFDKSRDNRVLTSKTNNLIPYFLDNLLKYGGVGRHQRLPTSWRRTKNRRLKSRFSDRSRDFSDKS